MPSLKSLGVPSKFLNARLSSIVPRKGMRRLEQHLLGKWFRNEQLSLGPGQHWLEREWELRLGSVRDTLYKVGLETLAQNYDESVELAIRVLKTITATLGAPERRGLELWIWDAEDGNVVLQIAQVMEERRIMIFLTSSVAKSFELK